MRAKRRSSHIFKNAKYTLITMQFFNADNYFIPIRFCFQWA